MIGALILLLALAEAPKAAPQAVVVQEADVGKREPPPHNGKSMSTAYRISDAVPNRSFEFRKRIMHRGAEIGLHVLGHDEVYYVLSGEGELMADGKTQRVGPGTAAYLYTGSNVGIRQVGNEDLSLIIAYPLPHK